MSDQLVPAEGYEYKIDLAHQTAVDQDLSPDLLAVRSADAKVAAAAQVAAATRQAALDRLHLHARTNSNFADLLIVLGL